MSLRSVMTPDPVYVTNFWVTDFGQYPCWHKSYKWLIPFRDGAGCRRPGGEASGFFNAVTGRTVPQRAAKPAEKECGSFHDPKSGPIEGSSGASIGFHPVVNRNLSFYSALYSEFAW